MFDELWPLGKTRLRRQIPQFNVARAALNISERRLRWRSIKLSFDRMDGALGAMLERRIGVCLNQSAPLWFVWCLLQLVHAFTSKEVGSRQFSGRPPEGLWCARRRVLGWPLCVLVRRREQPRTHTLKTVKHHSGICLHHTVASRGSQSSLVVLSPVSQPHCQKQQSNKSLPIILSWTFEFSKICR